MGTLTMVYTCEFITRSADLVDRWIIVLCYYIEYISRVHYIHM